MFGFKKNNSNAGKIIEEFSFELDVALMTVVRTTKPIFLRNGYSEQEALIISGQISNYLLGLDLNKISPNVTNEVRKKIIEIKPQIEPTADMIMDSDKNLKDFVVFMLQKRLEVEKWLKEQGSTSYDSGEERIKALQSKYGTEYPKEVEEFFNKTLQDARP